MLAYLMIILRWFAVPEPTEPEPGPHWRTLGHLDPAPVPVRLWDMDAIQRSTDRDSTVPPAEFLRSLSGEA